ncbi:hypothetical protein EON67_11865 [archaeon]|nr:MAG: hypothetical protein EON67_11865 [archaeon]
MGVGEKAPPSPATTRTCARWCDGAQTKGGARSVPPQRTPFHTLYPRTAAAAAGCQPSSAPLCLASRHDADAHTRGKS